MDSAAGNGQVEATPCPLSTQLTQKKPPIETWKRNHKRRRRGKLRWELRVCSTWTYTWIFLGRVRVSSPAKEKTDQKEKKETPNCFDFLKNRTRILQEGGGDPLDGVGTWINSFRYCINYISSNSTSFHLISAKIQVIFKESSRNLSRIPLDGVGSPSATWIPSFRHCIYYI